MCAPLCAGRGQPWELPLLQHSGLSKVNSTCQADSKCFLSVVPSCPVHFVWWVPGSLLQNAGWPASRGGLQPPPPSIGITIVIISGTATLAFFKWVSAVKLGSSYLHGNNLLTELSPQPKPPFPYRLIHSVLFCGAGAETLRFPSSWELN